MNVISSESFAQVLKATAFTDRYEKLYPDISKGIRGRRAQFYLLVNTSSYISNMFHHGLIESKDQKQLCEEIDDKIFFMKKNHTEVKVLESYEIVMIQQDLCAIFSDHELEEALKD